MHKALMALALVGCIGQGGEPSAPSSITASRHSQLASSAPGDTLRYTISWSAGARATGYQVTTTVTQGSGWSGLLTNTATPSLSIPFTPINTSAWDSVSFQACVVSTAPNKPNSLPRCTTWKLIRAPGIPGQPSIDSSQVIASILVRPKNVTVSLAGNQQFCPYVKALDGGVRFISGYESLSTCQQHYDTMVGRLPGYPVATARQTGWYGLNGIKVAFVRSAQDELSHVIFSGPFS